VLNPNNNRIQVTWEPFQTYNNRRPTRAAERNRSTARADHSPN
jgi:hypothetical protein